MLLSTDAAPVSHSQPLLVRAEGVRQPAESCLSLARCGGAEEKRGTRAVQLISQEEAGA